MKKACNVSRALSSLVSALGIVLATASHALANNAPGPLAVVSMLSLVTLFVVLTFAGGGYNVIKRLDDAKYPSKVKRTIMNTLEFIAGVVLFLAGMMATILGVLALSLFTIGRGVKMLQWSKAASREGVRPSHLEGANPARLRFAGIVLIVLTLLVFGYSMGNIDEVTGAGDSKRWRYASMLQRDAENAHKAAKEYLAANPKAGKVVTCEDMTRTGYTPSPSITCFSDMTATSGVIRMTGPEHWKLKKPVATITFSGELTPAER
jgi:hypothetical protein